MGLWWCAFGMLPNWSENKAGGDSEREEHQSILKMLWTRYWLSKMSVGEQEQDHFDMIFRDIAVEMKQLWNGVQRKLCITKRKNIKKPGHIYKRGSNHVTHWPQTGNHPRTSQFKPSVWTERDRVRQSKIECDQWQSDSKQLHQEIQWLYGTPPQANPTKTTHIYF